MILPDVEAGQRVEEGLKRVEFLSAMTLDEWGAQPYPGTNHQKITFNFKRIER
jgi:hypothetical protein